MEKYFFTRDEVVQLIRRDNETVWQYCEHVQTLVQKNWCNETLDAVIVGNIEYTIENKQKKEFAKNVNQK